MWYDEALVYQIYPLGFCGAPYENDGVPASRILKITEWIPHMKELGVTCVLLNPVMESDRHGYDTRDYLTCDTRLGTNADLQEVCRQLHDAGMKTLFDGVFNHTGRGFWAFRDLQEHKWDSPYKDWYHVNFDGDTNYHDGFWYEPWEGHLELAKLNLWNEAVIRHQFDAIRSWVDLYDIDGLRLDVAYCLPPEYLQKLRSFTNELKADFVLVGETLHGDYNRWMSDRMCHSVTNYECYKGLYSSFNSMNMFEIGYSLNRQFGSDPWCLYTGRNLLSFCDNHDVPRIATTLQDPRQLKPLWSLVFTMPGVPAVYYGSEWGITGDKGNMDQDLRPCLDKPEWNDLTDWIAALARVRQENPALCYGDYHQVQCLNKGLVFSRSWGGHRIITAINASGEALDISAGGGQGRNLLTDQPADLDGQIRLEPWQTCIWLVQD